MSKAQLDSTYRINIDGDWSLKNFYELPHTFGQVYTFHCAFLLVDTARDPERLIDIFSAFPWRGGYSAVNFYNSLNSQIPRQLRPKVISIQYASPGWIELNLLLSAALKIGTAVGIFVKSSGALNTLYKDIYQGFHERKLMRIDLKRKEIELSREQIDFALEMSERLAASLGFDRIEELHERTGHPLATLKVLLSYYRRIRTLSEFAISRKAYFPNDEDFPKPIHEPSERFREDTH